MHSPGMQTDRKPRLSNAHDCLGAAARLLMLAALLSPGCKSSPAKPYGAAELAQVAPRPPQVPEAPAARPAPDRAADQQAVAAMMAEIERIEPLEPSVRARLAEDLAQTAPELRPLVLQQFRASVAYRRQMEQREMLAGLKPEPAAEPRPATALLPAEVAARPAPATAPDRQRASQREPDLGGEAMEAGYSGVQDAPVSGDRPAAADQPERAAYPLPQAPPSGAACQAPGAIQLTSHVAPSAACDDWQYHLAAAIRSLEAKPLAEAQSVEAMAEHARLRLLYLLAQRRDDAVRPIPVAASELRDAQEFWSNELYGLAVWLDSQRTADTARRAEEARRHLGAALTRLARMSPLVVRNLAFVTEVQSFGSYQQCKKYEFAPEEMVLLYAEVENLTSEQTPRGFHAARRSSYQILDGRGHRVAEHESASSEEYCQNPRRDFFIGCQFRLPKRIYPGKHTLQFTVEDLKAQKVGQSSIEFSVKGDGV